MIFMNRTVKFFLGFVNQLVIFFFLIRSMISFIVDFFAFLFYFVVIFLFEVFFRVVFSSIVGLVQSFLWFQFVLWFQVVFYDVFERIVFRDERIVVLAKRIGILQEVKRRSIIKFMFIFKEFKVSLNFEFLLFF